MSSVCRRGGGVALCHEELARTTTNYNSSLVAGLLDCVRVEESQRSSRAKNHTEMPFSPTPFGGAEGWGTASRCSPSMKRTIGATSEMNCLVLLDSVLPSVSLLERGDESHLNTLEPFQQALPH
jgi:hypothetical protein